MTTRSEVVAGAWTISAHSCGQSSAALTSSGGSAPDRRRACPGRDPAARRPSRARSPAPGRRAARARARCRSTRNRERVMRHAGEAPGRRRAPPPGATGSGTCSRTSAATPSASSPRVRRGARPRRARAARGAARAPAGTGPAQPDAGTVGGEGGGQAPPPRSRRGRAPVARRSAASITSWRAAMLRRRLRPSASRYSEGARKPVLGDVRPLARARPGRRAARSQRPSGGEPRRAP